MPECDMITRNGDTMPVLSNPRHERFCQYLAQGKTASEAYELAGYKPSRFNASHLADNPKVIERLQQITTEIAKVSTKITQVTVESLIEQAQQVRASAMESKQLSAAVAAIKEVGVLSGVRVERKEVGAPGEFETMSDAELLAALRERMAKLESELDPSDSKTQH
jgi:phage terminase small subunit